jgi:hypothetical protein
MFLAFVDTVNFHIFHILSYERDRTLVGNGTSTYFTPLNFGERL